MGAEIKPGGEQVGAAPSCSELLKALAGPELECQVLIRLSLVAGRVSGESLKGCTLCLYELLRAARCLDVDASPPAGRRSWRRMFDQAKPTAF